MGGAFVSAVRVRQVPIVLLIRSVLIRLIEMAYHRTLPLLCLRLWRDKHMTSPYTCKSQRANLTWTWVIS